MPDDTGGFTSEAYFQDRRVATWASKNYGSCPGTPCGGDVEVFKTATQADGRATYLQSLVAGQLIVRERDFVAGNVVLRLSGDLVPSAVVLYGHALQKVTGLPAQAIPAPPGRGGTIVVRGTPTQPVVTYTVRLDQVWEDLRWTSGYKATQPVQIEVTITNTGARPVLDETPAQDLTLTLLTVPGALQAGLKVKWESKYDSNAGTYDCQEHGVLPATWPLLNPARSLTGCVAFSVPSSLMNTGADLTVGLWWIPQGSTNQDQRSYDWFFPA